MNDDDNRPLKSRADAPPELVRMLKAMRNSDDDRERLRRVAQRLGPMLDAPPPSPRLWHYTLSRSGLIRLVIGGIGAGAIGLWIATRSPSAPAAAPMLQSPQLSAAQPAPTPEPPAELLARKPEAPVAPAPGQKSLKRTALAPATRKAPGNADASPTSAAGTENSRRASDGPASQPSAASAQSSQAPSPSLQPQAAQASTSSQPSAAEQPVRASEPQRPETTEKQASARRPAEQAEPASVRPPSETSLLFAARVALNTDPEAALRLLNEHATRFATGLLTPEREVLAIDALRRLGRKQEAEARTRHFRARYPNSLHLLPMAHKATP